MTRAVSAVMAGLLCALAGLRHAASLRADEARLRRWGTILERLSVILREQADPLPTVLRQAADADAAPDRLLHRMAALMQAKPLITMQDIFSSLCEPCIEHDVLTRMFAGLGRGTLENRLLATTQAASEISLMTTQAAQRAAKDAKLWQTLGWTGGACLTLLLL